jgi:hypothetical protein
MAVGPLIRIAIFLAIFAGVPGLAAESAPSLCFDSSKPSIKLLRPPPPRFPDPGKEQESFGKDATTGFDWAAAAGRVSKPIGTVLEKLLDPMTTRDRETTTVEMEHQPVKGAIDKQHIKIKVKPFFFLTLEWEEDWLYSIKKGTPAKMESVVISYQKTSGTSHIEHFCGTILLQKLAPDTTGVFLTEEIKADRRSAEDVYRGLAGTLRTLRE